MYCNAVKISVFWDITTCIPWLQPPAYVGSSLADFYTLKMEAILSSETSIYTISTRLHIPEDEILHTHRHENLKSYFNTILVFTYTSSQQQISFLVFWLILSFGLLTSSTNFG
jgi:hypothetical protein